MKNQKEIVKFFYSEIWEKKNLDLVPTILNHNFSFHGSIGHESIGHKDFISYVEYIHAALGEYRCEVQALVSEPNTVFAKVKFKGTHEGSFLGYEPTYKELSWFGAALFNFHNAKITHLWVLGDLKQLEVQLENNRKSHKVLSKGP